ncbi:MAG TPA: SH3 domain-containing protein [Caulobacteraceae bacterium]|nr:SH3 domain-containing protein [Caulobacteraceae bacterium]
MGKKAAQALVLAATVLIVGCDGVRTRDARDPSTPSGFAVPRWLVLKFNEVNARSGPSDDNRVLWTYHTKGLPVQVVAETKDWRRICDPDGGLVWVQKNQVDGRRNVMRVKETPLELRRAPKDKASVEAYLKPRSVAGLAGCKDGWCKVKADGISAWEPAAELWGAAEDAQCKGGGKPYPPLPAAP